MGIIIQICIDGQKLKTSREMSVCNLQVVCEKCKHLHHDIFFIRYWETSDYEFKIYYTCKRIKYQKNRLQVYTYIKK